MSTILTGDQERVARACLKMAVSVARESQCGRAHCGSMIYRGSVLVVASGSNGPPGQTGARCHRKYELGPGFKSDRTCCIHAEQRAILAAGPMAKGCRIYFARADMRTGERLLSGEPYCTICSKMALEVGIAEWVLEHADGIRLYAAEEYNDLSFAYGNGPETVKETR